MYSQPITYLTQTKIKCNTEDSVPCASCVEHTPVFDRNITSGYSDLQK